MVDSASQSFAELPGSCTYKGPSSAEVRCACHKAEGARRVTTTREAARGCLLNLNLVHTMPTSRL